MRLNLYDKDLNRIAIIGERFISCLWQEGYNTVGSFSLELPSTDVYKKKLRTDCYVGRDDRPTLMVIKTVDSNNGRIVATGKQAARVLDDVAYIGTISADSSLTEAIVDAYEATSKFHLVEFAETDLQATYGSSISNKSILELLLTMCQSEDMGFRAVRGSDGILVEFFRPEQNPNLLFSPYFGNLGDVALTLSTENLKNYAIVLGEGEDAARERVDIDFTDGGDRLELIVDARDLRREDGESEAAYLARLAARGCEKLLTRQETLKCVFAPSVSDFGTRYDLGDILTVLLPDYGMKLQARVASFTQKAQNNKTETTIEVGTITIMR